VRRTVKYRVVTTLERLNNRLTRALLRRGWAPRWFGLRETTGRRTGLARHGTGGDAALGRLMASTPLTVRIDLDAD